MQETTVSEINIVPVKPKDGLVGFAAFIVDHKLYIGNVAIFTRLDGDGIRLVYPSKKVGVRDIDCVHPISRRAGDAITAAVQEKYLQLFSDSFSQDVNETQAGFHHSAE